MKKTFAFAGVAGFATMMASAAIAAPTAKAVHFQAASSGEESFAVFEKSGATEFHYVGHEKPNMPNKGEVVVTVRHAGAPPIYLDVKVDHPPSVYNDLQMQSYIASATTEGSKVELTPGAVTSGTLIEVTAFTDRNGAVDVHYFYQDSKLLGLPTEVDNGLKVQLPETSDFSEMNTLKIRPGQQVKVNFSGSGQNQSKSVSIFAEMIGS